MAFRGCSAAAKRFMAAFALPSLPASLRAASSHAGLQNNMSMSPARWPVRLAAGTTFTHAALPHKPASLRSSATCTLLTLLLP